MEQDTDEERDAAKRELIRIVSLAGEVAASVPQYGDRAFDKVLDYLLKGGELAPLRAVGQARNAPREARGTRRAPKADAAALVRIKPILEADPALAAEFPELMNLPPKAQIYLVLSVAHERFSIDGLSVAELRAVMNEKFRIGMPEGTLTGNLSKAPATELGRTTGPSGEIVYRLLSPGEAYLKAAQGKAAAKGKVEGAAQ